MAKRSVRRDATRLAHCAYKPPARSSELISVDLRAQTCATAIVNAVVGKKKGTRVRLYSLSAHRQNVGDRRRLRKNLRTNNGTSVRKSTQSSDGGALYPIRSSWRGRGGRRDRGGAYGAKSACARRLRMAHAASAGRQSGPCDTSTFRRSEKGCDRQEVDRAYSSHSTTVPVIWKKGRPTLVCQLWGDCEANKEQ